MHWVDPLGAPMYVLVLARYHMRPVDPDSSGSRRPEQFLLRGLDRQRRDACPGDI
jgi:hypothetical protein